MTYIRVAPTVYRGDIVSMYAGLYLRCYLSPIPIDNVEMCLHPVAGNYHKISQMPVIIIPLQFDLDTLSHATPCQHSVVLRPFVTSDFMTGVAAQPGKHLPEQVCSLVIIFLFVCPVLSFPSFSSHFLVILSFLCFLPQISELCQFCSEYQNIAHFPQFLEQN